MLRNKAFVSAQKYARTSTRTNYCGSCRLASGEADEDQTKTRIFPSEKNRIARKLQQSDLRKREKENEREGEELDGAHRG